MKDIAVRNNRERARTELQQLKDSMPKQNLLEKLVTRQDEIGDILRLSQKDPVKAKELADAIEGKNPEEAMRILRQRIGGEEVEPKAPEAKAVQADNVGIAASAGQVKEPK